MTYFGAALFYICLALLLREIWKNSRDTKKVIIDETTNNYIDKLIQLKQEYSKISQFIFDYEQIKDNGGKEYFITWVDNFGENKAAKIFRSFGNYSTDTRKNLKQSAEAYRVQLSDEIDKTIEALYKHHKGNVKNAGNPIFIKPLSQEIAAVLNILKEDNNKK